MKQLKKKRIGLYARVSTEIRRTAIAFKAS